MTVKKLEIKRLKKLSILLLLLILPLSCDQPFSLEEVLDGPEGLALAISPSTYRLVLNETLAFRAEGGVPPYAFYIESGNGSIDELSGVYTAPASTGNSIVTVVDSKGLTAQAGIEIIAGSVTSSALAISPQTISLNAGSSLSFSASGGQTPYSYSLVSGNGSINSTTGLYTASSAAGTDTIRVADSAGSTSDAVITITEILTNVDYAVTSVTDTSSTTVGGDPVSGTFTLNNGGSANGGKNIDWVVYASSGDTVFSTDDTIIATGTASPLGSGASSVVSFSGGWPASAGTYYFIVKVSSNDDINNTANNTAASSGTAITAAPTGTVDYQVATSPAGGSSPLIGSSLSETFTIENITTSSGVQNIYWTAYLSSDTTLTVGTDPVIDTGSIGFLTSLQVSSAVTITGSWPSSSGNYYILINLSAGDDIDPSNNLTPSSAVYTVSDPDIDYMVTTGSITTVGSPALGGSAVSESFTITNNGADGGSQNIYWTAYVSSDAVLDTTGDTYADSGSVSSLAGGATSTAVSIDSGYWPTVGSASTYYLFVNLYAIDETAANTGNNNEYAAYTVNPPDVDYVVTASSLTTTGDPALGGSALNETFTITNRGADTGGSTVYWTAYISTDATLDIPGDTYADSGSISFLAGGAISTAVTIDNGYWPVVSSSTSCYLFVDLTAGDETAANTGNNSDYVTFTVNPPDIDYVVTTGSLTTTGDPALGGSALSESFTVTNNGTDSGSQNIIWKAYISSDATLDDSVDTLIDSGYLSSLSGGGGSTALTIDNGYWPTVSSSSIYYLFVDLYAGDETAGNETNNSSSVSFTVDPPDIDYAVTSLTAALNPALGGSALGETFTITNSGADTGTSTIYWTAYISTDATLDAGDTPVDSGSLSALAGGAVSASQAVNNGNWPVVSSSTPYYLFVEVEASDETTGNEIDNSSSVSFTVDPPDIDYAVTSLTAALNPALGGSALGETFTITNSGADTGTSTIYWTAYISTDATLDAGDTPVDSGSLSALAGGAVSASQAVNNGNWPVVSSSTPYYLFVEVEASDETTGNEIDNSSSVSFTVNPPTIDYQVTAVTSGTPTANVSTAISETFTVQNGGADNGSSPVNWYAYYSTDATLEIGTDILIDSGVISALTAGASSSGNAITGTWPESAGTFYLLVRVSATDETTTSNNSGASAVFTLNLPTIDYQVTAVTSGTPTANVSTAISETFTVQNGGADNGSSPVNWYAYYSTDATLEIGTDILIDSGVISALTAGASSSGNAITGTWPESAGTFYLLVRVSATDETTTSNNSGASAVFTLNPPTIDYQVTAVTSGTPTANVSTAISETFTVQNGGADNGSSPVNWYAYYSTDATLEIGTDILIDSGVISALTAGASSSGNAITGTWPESVGTYYLLVRVSATDETTTSNNSGASAVFTINPPAIDYVVTSGSLTTTGDPALGGSALNETFTITNNGADTGSGTVYWTAYISTDAALDAGDSPVDSGSTSALAGSATSAVHSINNGNWPAVSSSTPYFLFVEVSASDETTGNETNNSSYVSFTVNSPDIDYVVTTVSNTGTPADTGTAISEIFTVQNSGSSNGSSSILWTAYYSTDTVLDGSDTSVDSGLISALNSGASSSGNTITGTWPGASGTYYLIVKVTAADETDPTNNYTASGSFTISSPGSVDYIVSSVSSDYKIVTTSSPLSESFTITNAGTAGTNDITWEAYASTDTVWDGADTLLGSGSISALVAGATSSDINLNGINWPVTPGSYYLVMKISTADAGEITTNNEGYSGVFTVNDPPDYTISSSVLPVTVSGGNINETLSSAGGIHTFTVAEQDGYPGKQTISWNVYYSTDPSLDGGDILIDSGTNPPLAAYGSFDVSLDALNLPATYGYYYLIMQIQAGDDADSGNNSVTSDEISVWDASGSSESATVSEIYDYAILLNSGDTVVITGSMNDYQNLDYFMVTAGTDANSLDVTLTWSTGFDDLDIKIKDKYGDDLVTSVDSTADIEPASPPLSYAVTPGEYYYVCAYAWLDMNGSGSNGQSYSMTITAGP